MAKYRDDSQIRKDRFIVGIEGTTMIVRVYKDGAVSIHPTGRFTVLGKRAQGVLLRLLTEQRAKGGE